MEDSPANRRSYLLRDWEFHTYLLQLADSAPLTNTMQSVNIMVLAFGGGVLRPLREVMAEHEAIFDALAKRDPDAAETAMRIHIHRSVTFLHGQADMAEEAAAALSGAAPDARLGKSKRTGSLSPREHHVAALD
jgi:DNA-binding GntR family transcriptional regulator